MRPNRRALATTAATAALLLTAACGGANPEPAPLPKASTPSASPSPSASAAPAPPVMPAAAKAKTKAGAIAFAKHYVMTLNFAGSNGNVQELQNLTLKTCVKCEALATGIRDVYAAGGEIVGGGWTVTATKAYGFERGRFFLDATIDSAPQTVRKAANATSERFPGGKGTLRAFVLEWRRQAWAVSELDPTA